MSIQRWHGVHAGLVPDDDGPLVKYDDLRWIYNVTVGPADERERYEVTGESHPTYLCLAAKDEADAFKIAEGYGPGAKGSFVISIERLTPRSTHRGILLTVPWRRR